jgi:hypothetical protein
MVEDLDNLRAKAALCVVALLDFVPIIDTESVDLLSTVLDFSE